MNMLQFLKTVPLKNREIRSRVPNVLYLLIVWAVFQIMKSTFLSPWLASSNISFPYIMEICITQIANKSHEILE